MRAGDPASPGGDAPARPALRGADDVRVAAPATLGAEREALAGWLRRALDAATLEIVDTGTPPLNGASNDTLILDCRWTVAAGGADGTVGAGAEHTGGFVVRRPPKGFPLFPSYDLARQHRTMAALAATGVPVPELVGLELDPTVIGEPFYVMRRIDGQAPPDLPPYTAVGWLLDLAPAEQARLYASSIEMLARVHRVDLGAAKLGFLRTGTGGTGFDEQLTATEAWYRWAAEGEPQPILDRVLAWLLRNRPHTTSPEGLNWGDARLGNMLYQGLDPVAVLDWEMAAVGPPEVDLGWWLFLDRYHSRGMDHPWLPGFPDDATTVAMYEEAAGRPARDVHYFDVFGGFRFATIVLRASRGLIRSGRLPADSDYGQFNGATRLLADMLDLPTGS